jgi:hypothetical protein
MERMQRMRNDSIEYAGGKAYYEMLKMFRENRKDKK